MISVGFLFFLVGEIVSGFLLLLCFARSFGLGLLPSSNADVILYEPSAGSGLKQKGSEKCQDLPKASAQWVFCDIDDIKLTQKQPSSGGYITTK